MIANVLAPGEYWYEDVQPGDGFATGSLVVTESHIVAFAGLSGDFFDLHMDDEFAREQGFPARVEPGILGLALADGLKNRSPVRIMAVASLGWNWSFLAPILAGDRISVSVVVVDKKLASKGERGIVTLRLVVTKQDGTTVQEGEATLLTRRRPNALMESLDG